MASIGGVELGGRGPESAFKSAAAFWTTTAAPQTFVYSPEDKAWSVVISGASNLAIARCVSKLERDECLSTGFELCQQALDIVSFRGNVPILTKEASHSHTLLFFRDGQLVLQIVDVVDFKVKVGTPTIVARDKEGNVVPPKPEPDIWAPALRYYRMSQASADLFEAYRSMWLGFETLLHEICPKNVGEREGDWLARAVDVVRSRVRVDGVLPSECTNATDFLIGFLYKHVRLKLFHSKIADDFLPHNALNPESVARAYEILIHLVRKTLESFASIRGRSGGLFPAFFNTMIKASLDEGLRVFYTDDDSPIDPSVSVISPKGRSTYEFPTVNVVSNANNAVGFLASVDGSSILRGVPVRRIVMCSGSSSEASMVSVLDEPLVPDDVDCFQTLVTTRLINLSSPKLIF